MDKFVLIELHYLPSLEFFSSIYYPDKIILDVHKHFVKQTYRNRCYILTSNKIVPLTVPVKQGNKKIIYKDIEIDGDQKWLNTHWRTIRSSYGKAPFFEYYGSFFESILFKKHKYLMDMNFELLSLCLKLLNIEKKIEYTQEYNNGPEAGILDLRDVISPKIKYVKNNLYKENVYNQIFGKNFVSNLSIIDLLFCEGGNAKKILQNSTISLN